MHHGRSGGGPARRGCPMRSAAPRLVMPDLLAAPEADSIESLVCSLVALGAWTPPRLRTTPGRAPQGRRPDNALHRRAWAGRSPAGGVSHGPARGGATGAHV
jgi:hypothetical protein